MPLCKGEPQIPQPIVAIVEKRRSMRLFCMTILSLSQLRQSAGTRSSFPAGHSQMGKCAGMQCCVAGIPQQWLKLCHTMPLIDALPFESSPCPLNASGPKTDSKFQNLETVQKTVHWPFCREAKLQPRLQSSRVTVASHTCPEYQVLSLLGWQNP